MSRSNVVVVILVFALAIPFMLYRPQEGESGGREPLISFVASSSAAPDGAADTVTAARAHARRTSRDPHQRQHGSHQESAKQQRKRHKQCVKAGWMWLPKSGMCTHGPDPVPTGVRSAGRPAPLPATASRVAAESVTCDGDGQSGPRVQVLYARTANVRSHYATYLASFRAWAANVDGVMRASAAQAGGSRRIRFVTTFACEIDVQEVVLAPSGDDSPDHLFSQLKTRGYGRTDRKYLIFMDTDTNSQDFYGIATTQPDDRPGQANQNNSGPSYARVYPIGWDTRTPAHELMHTLGAVQNSAPNSTGATHCIDEYDVMCYADPPSYPTMRIDCPDVAQDDRYDCGNNDYFDPTPANSGYLATHWNTANSQFLVTTSGPADTEPPTVTWISPVANGEEYSVLEGEIALEVTATDDHGVMHVAFRRYDWVRERWFRLAIDATAPYTASLNVAALQPGNNYVSATAYDAWGNQTEEPIFIWKEGEGPPIDPTPEPPLST